MAVSPHRLMGTSVRAAVPGHARACCFVLAGGRAEQLALSPPQVPVRASGIWTGWEDKERPRFRFCLGERCHGVWSTPRSRIHVREVKYHWKKEFKGGGAVLAGSQGCRFHMLSDSHPQQWGSLVWCVYCQLSSFQANSIMKNEGVSCCLIR